MINCSSLIHLATASANPLPPREGGLLIASAHEFSEKTKYLKDFCMSPRQLPAFPWGKGDQSRKALVDEGSYVDRLSFNAVFRPVNYLLYARVLDEAGADEAGRGAGHLAVLVKAGKVER